MDSLHILILSSITLCWTVSVAIGDCPCPIQVEDNAINCGPDDTVVEDSRNNRSYRAHDDPGHRGLTGDCLPDVAEK